MSQRFILIYEGKGGNFEGSILSPKGLTSQGIEKTVSMIVSNFKLTEHCSKNTFKIFYHDDTPENSLRKYYNCEIVLSQEQLNDGDSTVPWRHFEYLYGHPNKSLREYNKILNETARFFQIIN